MRRKYMAFDIEIAKIIPGQVNDLKSHRPLGVCCAAALASDDENPHLWYSVELDGSPTSQMTREDLAAFLHFLREQQEQGYTLLSWNGLSFDFDILAEESGEFSLCQSLAIDHVDMMFHIFCEKGFCVGLEAAAKGRDVAGKLEGMSTERAPLRWAEGETNAVLNYVTNDCRITLDVARLSEQHQEFCWLTSRGTIGSMSLPDGWRTCGHSIHTPLPDTSWMDNPPWPRSRFCDWFLG